MGIGTICLPFGVYSFWGNTEEDASSESLKVTTVEKGNIRQTIEVQGSAELVDEQELRFNQAGKITAVYFQDGDTISKGDTIAELDKTDVLNEIRQAEISLSNSQLSLQELIDGDTELSILKAENSIFETKQKITIAEKNVALAIVDEKNTVEELESELALAEKEVEEKKNDLETAQQDLENTIIFENEDMASSTNTHSASLESAFLEVKNSIIDADGILEKIDAILGVEEITEKNNDSFELYLGFRDLNTKRAAEDAYSAAKEIRNNLEEQYNELYQIDSISTDEIVALLELSESMFEKLIAASDDTYEMLQNTITSTTLSASDISSFESSMSSARSSCQSKISSLKNEVTNLKNLEDLGITELRSSDTVRKAEDSVRNAEYALEKSEDSLKTLQNAFDVKKENARLSRVEKENDLILLKKSLEVEQKDLEDIQEGASKEQIAMAENEVLQKKLSLEKVREDVENYKLIAPFDGVIRKIDFKVGDNLVSDENKYAYVENPDLLQITVLLDQIDIVKIAKGYPVRIVFDALSEKTFTSEITEIDKTPVEQSGVVSYEASILLERGDESIYSGMTATIEIIIEEKNDVLVVPTLSLTTQNGKTFVQVVENGIPRKQEVEVGAADGKNTEIVSGLNEGDEIVEIMTSTTSSTTTNSGGGEDSMRNFMRATGSGPGGGGGPPG